MSSYCPRSSLPATVLAWLATRLAHLAPPRPPGQGGTRPLPLEVRLDAVGAVLLDGLSYRRAGRVVGISKTEVGDSLDLLLGPLAALGFCQPDGSFIATLDQLGRWLSEMARAGEAVLVDGLGTRVQRPRGWANQKVLYDAKRHTHTAPVSEPGAHVQPQPALGDGQGGGAAVGVGGPDLPPLVGPPAEREAGRAGVLPGAAAHLQSLLGGQVAGLVRAVDGLGALGAVIESPPDLVARPVRLALANAHRGHRPRLPTISAAAMPCEFACRASSARPAEPLR